MPRIRSHSSNPQFKKNGKVDICPFYVLRSNSKLEGKTAKLKRLLKRVEAAGPQAGRIPAKEWPDQKLCRFKISEIWQNGASQGSVDGGHRSKVKAGLNRSRLNIHGPPERKSIRSWTPKQWQFEDEDKCMDYDARAKLWRTQKCPPPHTTEKKQRQENPITAAEHTLPRHTKPTPEIRIRVKKVIAPEDTYVG